MSMVAQVVVPATLQHKVVTLAHAAHMSTNLMVKCIMLSALLDSTDEELSELIERGVVHNNAMRHRKGY